MSNPTVNPGNVTDPEPATENSEAASYDETFPTNVDVIRDSFQIPALTRTLSGETLVLKTVTMDRDAIVLFVSGKNLIMSNHQYTDSLTCPYLHMKLADYERKCRRLSGGSSAERRSEKRPLIHVF